MAKERLAAAPQELIIPKQKGSDKLLWVNPYGLDGYGSQFQFRGKIEDVNFRGRLSRAEYEMALRTNGRKQDISGHVLPGILSGI